VPLDPSFVGRKYPPTAPYEVGREKIREFADAIGDPDPAYRDPAAARALGHPDVIAPPTFGIIMSMRATRQVTHDPELGLNYSRMVHGEQRFVFVRPIRAGDALTVTVEVENIRETGGNDLISMRGDVVTVDGERVLSAYSTLFVRAEEAE
jgi:acyl dehydratase